MRYWAECTCGNFKSAESLNEYWADAEGSKHLLPYRLGENWKDHTILLMHREVASV